MDVTPNYSTEFNFFIWGLPGTQKDKMTTLFLWKSKRPTLACITQLRSRGPMVIYIYVGQQGRIQDFKLGGAYFKKLRRAEGDAKIFGVFLAKKIIFFPILGGRAPGEPPSGSALAVRNLINNLISLSYCNQLFQSNGCKYKITTIKKRRSDPY